MYNYIYEIKKITKEKNDKNTPVADMIVDKNGNNQKKFVQNKHDTFKPRTQNFGIQFIDGNYANYMLIITACKIYHKTQYIFCWNTICSQSDKGTITVLYFLRGVNFINK